MSVPTNLFYVSVRVDPFVLAEPFKKIAIKYGIMQYSAQGRKNGKTYKSRQILAKIDESLKDCGAIPLDHTDGAYNYFATQLPLYWAKAIDEFSKIGVRIYIMPVLRAADGMPDAIEDAFNAHYTKRLNALLDLAKSGADVLDLAEITVALAHAFEDEEITLSESHYAIFDQIREDVEKSRARAQQIRDTPIPAAAVQPVFTIPSIPDDVSDLDLTDFPDDFSDTTPVVDFNDDI